jgi:hypothetical protein
MMPVVMCARRYTVGGTYEGAWAYDKRNGQGTMVYRNGDKYTGSLALPLAPACHLRNCIILIQCCLFAGMWFEDTRHGQGVMTFARGGGYEGQWQYDKESGHGHCVFPTGDKYTG